MTASAKDVKCENKFVKALNKEEKEEINKRLDNKLIEVINKLKDSFYLSRNQDFQAIRGQLGNPQTFRKAFSIQMPSTTYKNYKEICEKIYYEGGVNLLSEGRPMLIAKSGGSTGAPKYLPFYNRKTYDRYKEFPIPHMINIVQQDLDGSGFGPNSKGIELFNKKIWSYSPPDCKEDYEYRTPVGFISTQIQTSTNDIEPMQVKYIGNHRDRLFISLLFSLSYRDLEYFTTAFINMMADMLVILEEDWSNLLECIKTGFIPDNNTLKEPLDDSLREKIQARFNKDEKRYEELNSILEDERTHTNFQGILNKIWPKLTLIMGTASGAFEFHLKTVKFYTNLELTTIQDFIYGTSECGLLGAPLGLYPNHYILEEPHNYLEFLATDHDDEKNLVRSPDLEVGKEYELIFTNMNGWVRYKMEDIFQHEGWYKGSPVMSYVRRYSEEIKIDQAIVNQSTIIQAMELIPLNVFTFMCFEDSSSSPSKFGFFIELFQDDYYFEDSKCYHNISNNILADSCNLIDNKLKENSFLYQSMTQNGRVSTPVSIKIVPQNSFQQLREFKAKKSNSGSLTQIKLPLFSRGDLVDKLLEYSHNIYQK